MLYKEKGSRKRASLLIILLLLGTVFFVPIIQSAGIFTLKSTDVGWGGYYKQIYYESKTNAYYIATTGSYGAYRYTVDGAGAITYSAEDNNYVGDLDITGNNKWGYYSDYGQDYIFQFIARGNSGILTYSWDNFSTFQPWTPFDEGGYYSSVYCDGTYIHTTRGESGLTAYTWNPEPWPGAFTNVNTIDDGGNYTCVGPNSPAGTVFTGGTDGSNPCLRAYGFSGGAYTLKDTINNGSSTVLNIYYDGTYIYTANQGDGVYAYTFDGTDLTYEGHVAAVPSGSASDIYGDGTYIYVVYDTEGIKAYSFDGTTFTEGGETDDGGNYVGVICHGGYILTCCGDSGLSSYTYISGNPPAVTTKSVIVKSYRTATLRGHLDDTGGEPCTVRFKYGKTISYGTNTTNQTLPAVGNFSASLTGLDPGTLYHYRAYAENSIGGTLGDDYTFTTDPLVVPTVTTNDATGVGMTTATLQGTLTDDGGAGACTVRFQYGFTTSYGTTSPNQIKTIGQTFSYGLIGLTRGKLYHFQTIANNTVGTSYGTDKMFLTKPEGPTGLNVSNTDVGEQTLEWTHGTGYNRSVVRGTIGSYPATPQSGTDIYNGTGETVVHSGLTTGTWYYRVWEYSSWGALHQFSDNYTQAILALPSQGGWTPGLALTLIDAQDDAGWYWQTWRNGSTNQFYCAAANGGLKVYNVTNGIFTLITTASNVSWGPFCVMGDGRYIYVGQSGTDIPRTAYLVAYSFDGTNLHYINRVAVGGNYLDSLWVYNGYIHCTMYNLGMKAYTFDGANFHLAGSIAGTTNNRYGPVEVDADTDWVYVVRGDGISWNALTVYTFNGLGYTQIFNRTHDGVQGFGHFWLETGGNKVISANSFDGLYMYTFDGSSFPLIDQWDDEPGQQYYDVDAVLLNGRYCVFAVLNDAGVIAYNWRADYSWWQENHKDNGSGYYRVFYSDEYVYCTCWGDGVLAYRTQGNPPTVTTDGSIGVTDTGATLEGTLVNDGGAWGTCTVWFQYGITLYALNSVTQVKVTGDSFSIPISGLLPARTYHYRAVANNSLFPTRINNGVDRTFTTTGTVLTPTVVTNSATGIGKTYVTLQGLLTDDGGEVCTVDFQYGLTTSYSYDTNNQVKSTGETFSITLNTLSPDTTYHYRARAVNSGGIGYGVDRIFTTLRESITIENETIIVNEPHLFPLPPPKYPDGFTIPEMYALLHADRLDSSDASVTVMVIDSGILPVTYQNLSLKGITAMKDSSFTTATDDNGHGTWVNYAVAYLLNLKLKNAHQISYKVFGGTGAGNQNAFIGALQTAKELKPDIVSISAGVIGGTPSDVYAKACEDLRNEGIIVIVAAGNFGPSPSTMASPGCSDSVIAVAGSDPIRYVSSARFEKILDLTDDIICPWSSRGPVTGIQMKPDVAAPGESIRGPWLNSEKIVSGTSMATPLISGGAAVIIAQNKPLVDWVKTLYFWDKATIPQLFEDSLKSSCYPKGDMNTWGAGIVQFDKMNEQFKSGLYWKLIFFFVPIILIILFAIVFLSRRKSSSSSYKVPKWAKKL
jgi:hypothetical protein